MGKQVVPVKSVIYALSPFQQKIMPGLWKDLPTKIHHKVCSKLPGKGEAGSQVLSSCKS
ncbi:hypothetical protein JHK84_041066 [Glycine max]|nr:hypothetical protein JHK84_041066 [Glycine max]